MAKAYVLMSCNLGSEKDLIAKLNAIREVSEAHGTFGLYDILAKVESNDEEKIQSAVTGVIRKLPEIRSTMTLTRSECEELFKPADKLISTMLGKNTSQAYVVIHTEKSREYEVLRNLGHIPEVKEADVVFGYYDVLCKVESDSHKSLEKVVTKAIRSLPFIKTSITLNVITEQD